MQDLPNCSLEINMYRESLLLWRKVVCTNDTRLSTKTAVSHILLLSPLWHLEIFSV